jgi:DNA polymerase III subunit beta
MKFEIELSVLRESLELIKGVVERRQILPILSHVLLNASEKGLTLTGSDSEITIQVQTALVSIQKPGEATIPARKLSGICNRLPKEAILLFNQEKNRLNFKVNNSQFSFMSLEAAEFPDFIEPEVVQLQFYLPKAVLRDLIESTVFAVAEQDTRYYLNGMLWEIKPDAFHVVATDSHRLNQAIFYSNFSQTVSFEKNVYYQMIVPRKTVFEISRLLACIEKTSEETLIEVIRSAGQLFIRAPHYKLSSRLIDAQFPDYTKLLKLSDDNTVHVMRVDRDTLQICLSRLSVLLSEKYPGIQLVFSPSLLRLRVSNLEGEQAEEQLEIEGESQIEGGVSLAFNIHYLIDVVNVLPAGWIEFKISGPKDKVVLQHAEKRSIVYIIMPMLLHG